MNPKNHLFGHVVVMTIAVTALSIDQAIQIRALKKELLAANAETHLLQRACLKLAQTVGPEAYAKVVTDLRFEVQFAEISKHF